MSMTGLNTKTTIKKRVTVIIEIFANTEIFLRVITLGILIIRMFGSILIDFDSKVLLEYIIYIYCIKSLFDIASRKSKKYILI